MHSKLTPVKVLVKAKRLQLTLTPHTQWKQSLSQQRCLLLEADWPHFSLDGEES